MPGWQEPPDDDALDLEVRGPQHRSPRRLRDFVGLPSPTPSGDCESDATLSVILSHAMGSLLDQLVYYLPAKVQRGIGHSRPESFCEGFKTKMVVATMEGQRQSMGEFAAAM